MATFVAVSSRLLRSLTADTAKGHGKGVRYSIATIALAALSCAQLSADLVADFNDAVSKLRAVGSALQQYQADHGTNSFPGRLTNLVSLGYIEATNLICRADVSGGTEGAKPDQTLPGQEQHSELDETGCSFYYHFSEAPARWFSPHHSPGLSKDEPYFSKSVFRLASCSSWIFCTLVS